MEWAGDGNTGERTPAAVGAVRAAGRAPDAVPLPVSPPALPARTATTQTVPVPLPRHGAESPVCGWPLRDFTELGCQDIVVPWARHHARRLLGEWSLTRLADDVELLVAELVTNAAAASRCLEPPSGVRMWLASDEASVLISVWDANPLPPVRMAPPDDSEEGRGLLLVEAISAWWDWYAVPVTGGKVVRALAAK
jgi:anti-sigma regulatory factor (Ser/Thr protein kinase)